MSSIIVLDDHLHETILPHILKNPSRKPSLPSLSADIMNLPVEGDRTYQPVLLSSRRNQGKI